MKIFFCTIIIIGICAVPCYANTQAKSEVKKGNLLYNSGKFDDALQRYQQALVASPDSDVVHFNFGAAAYKLRQYDTAIEHFQRSLVSNNESLAQKASYNLGNAAYKYGMSKEESDLAGAVNLLKTSLHHYEQALAANEGDEDAKYNYDFAQKELKRLEEKLQKQQQQKQCPLPKEQEGQQKQSQEQQPGQEDKENQDQQQKQSAEKEQEAQEQAQDQQSEQEKNKSQEQAQQNQDQQQAIAIAQADQAQKMSEKEAQMLLEGYQHEEEPRGLYKGNAPVHNLPDVVKDW